MAARLAQPEVVATGLDNPRGLAFGPDGGLYVAEAGRGGAASTAGRHRQIPPPVGPYTGGMTARVSRIGPEGRRDIVADNLPSSQSSPGSGASVSGVADVAFLGPALYALVSGAGPSHGLEGTANGVYRIGDNGNAELVANLSAYRASTNVAVPDLNDDEYDGTWYSMVPAAGALWAVEPNHGVVVRVDVDGRISRLVDISETQGHIVPTAIAYREGLDAFFVGNLGRLPAAPGSARVLRIERNGVAGVWARGLTMVLGLAFDGEGHLYALENSQCDEPCRPIPGTGRVVRVGEDGSIDPIAVKLMLPTGMVASSAGDALYVTTGGIGPAGSGSILRIAL